MSMKPTPRQIAENALRMLAESERDSAYLLNGLPADGPSHVRAMGADFYRHPDGKWRMFPAAPDERWPYAENPPTFPPAGS